MEGLTSNIPECPDCKEKGDVKKIIYGYPSPQLMEESQKGTVVLGGCCPTPGINFMCKKCNKKFGNAI